MTTPTANQAVASSNDIFEPLVRGPDDPATPPKENAPPRSPSADHADLRQGGRDDAFVF
jgi:type IV secretion system protein VirB1